MRAPRSREARSNSATSSSISSCAGSSTSTSRMGLDELGELRRERRVGRHRDAPGGVAQEEAAGPVHRVRLGELPEVGRRGAVPDVEEREVRLAVLAHLERSARPGPASCRRAARARTSAPGRRAAARRAAARARRSPSSKGSSKRPSPASVAPSSSDGDSPWSVRTRKCPRPSRATTVQIARQRSESLSQASTSGLGTRSGKRPRSASIALRDARVRGHSPVLAAPVEPAPAAAP